jgi:hypothetical protein
MSVDESTTVTGSVSANESISVDLSVTRFTLTYTRSGTANATDTNTLRDSLSIVESPTESLVSSFSRSLGVSHTGILTVSKNTKTLVETRTRTPECGDFSPVTNPDEMVQRWSSTQPYLVRRPQGGAADFIIPREVFATSPMNVTIVSGFPQLLRTSPLQVTFAAQGPAVTITGEILNRTAMLLRFSRVFLPSTQSKFVDLTLVVTVSSSNFVCGDRWTDIPVSISIQASSRALDLSSQNAVGSAASAASVAGVNPAAAATQARTKMLSALIVCSFDLESDNGNSITGLFYGAKKGQYLRGSIVGNWIVLFLFTLVLLLLAFTCARIIHRRHGLKMRDAWESMTCIMHIPSACLVPMGLVLQPTVSSTVTLIMYPTGSSDAILAAASIVGTLVLLGVLLVTCLSRFECELVPDEPLQDGASPLVKLIFYLKRFFEGSMIWRTRRGCDPLWKMRYHLIFNDYRFSWFALVEIAISVMMGIVNGVKVNADGACFVQLCLMLALYSIIFLLVAILRPGISLFTQIFLFLANFIGFICCVLIVIGIVTANDSAFAYSDYLVMMLFVMSSVVSLKEMVKMVFLIPLVLRYVATLRKHPSFMTDTELEQHRAKKLADERNASMDELIDVDGDGLLQLPRPGLQSDSGNEDDHDDRNDLVDELRRWKRMSGPAAGHGVSALSSETLRGRDGSPSYRREYVRKRRAGADAFSLATGLTQDLDIRTLPSLSPSHSSGDSSPSVQFSDDNDPFARKNDGNRAELQQKYPQGQVESPDGKIPRALSLLQALESGAPLSENRTDDPFSVPPSRTPSIWRRLEDPNLSDGEDRQEAERRRRRRRKTKDYDDLL